MRLIDADALMKTLGITDMDCEKCALRNKTYPVCNRGEGFPDACSAIEDAPTIEERKKGKWIRDEKQSKKHIEPIFVCSACHDFSAWGEDEKYNYCPNCGADMRGEEDESED